MKYEAVISDDGLYRYKLMREWDDAKPRVTFVMLNPSTADAKIDDPTIRRCLGFARRWDMGSLCVLNLFAYRATDPGRLSVLFRDEGVDPVGPENNDYILRTYASAAKGDRLIFAWGSSASGPKVFERAAYVLHAADLWGLTPYCLGKTTVGHPRHPLYVKGDKELEAYR